MAMISIAHPDFRNGLFIKAKEMGLLGKQQTLSEAMHGVYPVHLEEVREIDGETVTIRPAKPVDQRRIQEHFYHLSKDDVVSRFFHEKTAFLEKDVKGVTQVDYLKDLTIIATVGDIGFSRVIAVGESLLDESKNIAEVAFSVSKDWQGKKMGKILIQKLAQAARDNGIAGLVAYTAPHNQGMIRLFKTLPYRVRNTLDGDMLELRCNFKEAPDSP